MNILLLTVGTVNYNCDINFFEPLKNIAHNVIRYNYIEKMNAIGKRKMNKEIINIVKTERPEYVFFITYGDKIIKDSTLDKIGILGSKVIAWFGDDHRRFDNYSRFVSKHIFCSITTDKEAYKRYKDLCLNVIMSQWASNPNYYKKISSNFKYDVTFVGNIYGDRLEFINFLIENGISLHIFSRSFGNFIKFDDMIKVFNESKINLNFSGSSSESKIKQIKGRVFETTMCGGFLLTEYVEGLEEYFCIGEEIECFSDRNELLKKINYYLINEEKRKKIAEAGQKASFERHTWEKRLRNVFDELNKTKDMNRNQSQISKLKEILMEIKMRDMYYDKKKLIKICKNKKYKILKLKMIFKKWMYEILK